MGVSNGPKGKPNQNEAVLKRLQFSLVRGMKERISAFLALFTSVGTLICCALPILLVTLGMGMAMAGLISAAPWLVTLSQHKAWVFTASGLTIAFSWFVVYGLPRKRSTRCVGENETACEMAGRFTRAVLWSSVLVYLLGFFTAYLYLPLRSYLSG